MELTGCAARPRRAGDRPDAAGRRAVRPDDASSTTSWSAPRRARGRVPQRAARAAPLRPRGAARCAEHASAAGAPRHRGVRRPAPGSLPYPVRKRVALARALAADPTLLLLDEPASGLSHDEIEELGELVRGLTDADGRAARGAPHGPGDARLRRDHRARLRQGDRRRHARTRSRDDPAVLAAYLGDAMEQEADADDRGAEHQLRPGAPRWTRSPSPPTRQGHRGARRQRSRQDDPAAHHLRADPAAGSGTVRLRRTADHPDPGRADARLGMAHVPGGTRGDHRADRRGEPPPRRARPRPAGRAADLDRVYDLFPRARRNGAPRWPTPSPVASARCWSSGGR